MCAYTCVFSKYTALVFRAALTSTLATESRVGVFHYRARAGKTLHRPFCRRQYTLSCLVRRVWPVLFVFVDLRACKFAVVSTSPNFLVGSVNIATSLLFLIFSFFFLRISLWCVLAGRPVNSPRSDRCEGFFFFFRERLAMVQW